MPAGPARHNSATQFNSRQNRSKGWQKTCVEFLITVYDIISGIEDCAVQIGRRTVLTEKPMAGRRARARTPNGSLQETLLAAGLEPRLADLLSDMPHRSVQVDPRRPFREPGAPRDEVIFV